MNVVPPAEVINVITGNFQFLGTDPAIAVGHITASHGEGSVIPGQFHYLWMLQFVEFVTTGFRNSIFVRYSTVDGQIHEERRVRFPANFPVGWNVNGITPNLTLIYNRAADVIVTAYPGR